MNWGLGHWGLGLAAVAVIGFAGWVRLAPVDAARWHKVAYPSGMGHVPSAGGHIWRGEVTGDGAATLARLDRIIRDTPRSRLIAGAVGERMVSYEIRSPLWGFPDYVTLSLGEGLIEDGSVRYVEIYSRLRFGTSDLGVNRGRIERWLAALGEGG